MTDPHDKPIDDPHDKPIDDPIDEAADAESPAPAADSEPAEPESSPAGEDGSDAPPAEGAIPGLPEGVPAASPYQAAQPTSPLAYVFFAGLLLLVIGLLWLVVEQELSIALDLWIFAATVAVMAPLAWHLPDVVQVFRSRRALAFVFVVLTITLGCVGLVTVSAINWTLHEKGKLWDWDATRTGDHSLSEETTKLFEEIRGTVYVTYLEYPGTPPGIRARTQDQIQLFAHTFSNLEYQRLDPQRHRDEAKARMEAWGIVEEQKDERGDLVVFTYAEAGREIARGRSKQVRVDPYEWVKTTELGEGQWLGERILSSAILELVFQRVKAYTTGGHGELDFNQSFRRLQDRLAGQNIELVDAPLQLSTSPQVPADCDILIVLRPRTSFSSDEERAVKDWLATGEKVLYLAVDVVSAMDDPKPRLGLESVLGEFGLEPRLGFSVHAPVFERMEGSGDVLIRGFSETISATRNEYTAHPAAAAIRSGGGLGTIFFRSAFVHVAEEPPPGAEPRVVVHAPFPPRRPGMAVNPRSYGVKQEPGRVVASVADPNKDVIDQKLPIVVTSARTYRPQGVDKISRVVVFGDTHVLSDVTTQKAPGNLDLAVGLVQWALQREGLVAISEKTLSETKVQMNARMRRLALWWPIGLALLPLILGGAVWWSRRR